MKTVSPVFTFVEWMKNSRPDWPRMKFKLTGFLFHRWHHSGDLPRNRQHIRKCLHKNFCSLCSMPRLPNSCPESHWSSGKCSSNILQNLYLWWVFPPSNKRNLKPWISISGHTDDFDSMVHNLVAKYPTTKVVCVGFSLGGNLVTKYMGDKTHKRPDNVIGGISICQGYNAVEWVFFLRLPFGMFL